MTGIPKAARPINPRIIVLLLLFCASVSAAAFYFLSGSRERFVQLSEKPVRQANSFNIQPLPSTLGLNLQIPYTALRRSLEKSTDNPEQGQGEKRICKKVLIDKLCATLQWNYAITRSGKVTAEQQNDAVRLVIPLSLKGTISVAGKSARLFGLTGKDVTAKLMLVADVKTQTQPDWCITLDNSITYRWIEEPRIRVAGNIRVNLRKSVDKALKKQLPKFEKNLSSVVDCSKFRQRLEQQWKMHQIPLKLPDQTPAYLVVKPQSAHISDSLALRHALNIAVELNATTEVTTRTPTPESLRLPELSPQSTGDGVVEFSVLLKLPYENLNDLLAQRLVNSDQTDSGFTVTSVDLYPSGDRLVVAVGFTSQVASRFMTTNGELFLSGKPAADAENNLLKFDEVSYTRIIDRKLFDVISAMLHKQILNSIQKEALIDLSSQLKRLEQSVSEAFDDPAKTGGLHVRARTPEIKLVAINPESDGLALIVHLSTELTATAPVDALLK